MIYNDQYIKIVVMFTDQKVDSCIFLFPDLGEL